MYQKTGKRLLDLLIVIPALLLLSPIYLALILLVRWKLGTPIFFHQQRPGQHGQPFTIYKFRTMKDAWNKYGRPLPDEKRLTRFGRLLRSTSLDELPELINVLKGEMSLVGPRPLLTQYLDLYTPEQQRRHDVVPGITGWAQINGRNAISWEEKFKLDIWYVENLSLWLDIKILIKTFLNVIQRKDISQPGEATIKPFNGHQNA